METDTWIGSCTRVGNGKPPWCNPKKTPIIDNTQNAIKSTNDSPRLDVFKYTTGEEYCPATNMCNDYYVYTLHQKGRTPIENYAI